MKFDEIHELDDNGLMGFLLYGEPTIEDVELWLATEGQDYDGYGIFETAETNGWDIVPTYVRKVPHHDGYGYGTMKYVYQNGPGPGASRCVRVEPFTAWDRWCANHIYERASVGIPVEQVKDPVWPRVRDGYAHLCSACARSFHARMEVARAEALIAQWEASDLADAARWAESRRARLPELRALADDAVARVKEMDAA